MLDYAAWTATLPHRLVFVAYPVGFDFTFVSYYLFRFTGKIPSFRLPSTFEARLDRSRRRAATWVWAACLRANGEACAVWPSRGTAFASPPGEASNVEGSRKEGIFAGESKQVIGDKGKVETHRVATKTSRWGSVAVQAA